MRLVYLLGRHHLRQDVRQAYKPLAQEAVLVLGYLAVSSANLPRHQLWAYLRHQKVGYHQQPVALGRNIDPYDQARSQEPRDWPRRIAPPLDQLD